MNNLLLLVAAIGLTMIVKYGFILNAPREFIKNKALILSPTLGKYVSKLLSCSQCLGFWCGFGIFLLTGILEHSYELIIYYSILFGFISSICSNIIDMLLTYLDENIFKLQKENESKTKED